MTRSFRAPSASTVLATLIPGTWTPATLALVTLVLVAAPWLGAQAAPKAAPTVTYTVKVSNGRSSPITTLTFSLQGAETMGPNLLKKPIPAGTSASVVVKAAKGQCLFDVGGSFEDGEEISGSGLDLCRDRTLALVD